MSSWAGRVPSRSPPPSVRSGSRPREVVAEHLARDRASGSTAGSGRSGKVRAQAALAEADALASRTDLTELPLAGVPLAVKDNLAVRGESGRNGSAATPDAPAAEDHVTVARLRAAGAVVVGLTNVPELCVFGTTEGRTAPPAIRGTSPAPRAAPPAAARRRSPRVWCRSRSATTGWARCASRPRTAGWSH